VDEEAVFRKVNRRILPLLCCVVIFCYLDRTNLAYASLQFNEDLKFDDRVYGLGSGFFFLGYALFQVSGILPDTQRPR
jgi:sugar phosphate permease